MQRRGFTLIELLVVIAIIGILATFAVVQFTGARDKARLAKGMAFSQSVLEGSGDEAVGIWDFDECGGTVLSDRSGFGNNGTLISSPVWSTDTPSGKGCSLLFDGATQYVQVPDASSLDLGTSDFTFSIWVKRNGAGAGANSHVLGKTGDGNPTDYELFLRSAGGVGSRVDGQSVESPVGGIPSSDTRWHHIVATFDRDKTGTIYIDGSMAGSPVDISAVTNSVGTPTPLYIGRRQTNNYWNGYLDDVRIFTKALTAQEVSRLFAENATKHLAQTK